MAHQASSAMTACVRDDDDESSERVQSWGGQDPSSTSTRPKKKAISQIAAPGFKNSMSGCQLADVVSAVVWPIFFVMFSADRLCVLFYYGVHFVRSMLRRTDTAPGLPGIRFWCLAHAVLDFVFFHVTTSPPAIYFPVHIAAHMALAWDLAKTAKRRIAAGRAMSRCFDFLVSLKLVFVILTTLREMKIMDWKNPTFFAGIGLAHVPPLDDMGGAVIFMVLAMYSSPVYGGFIFALHLVSASLIGPCTPGEVTCEKNVFNNMIWCEMTCLFHAQLVAQSGKPASGRHPKKIA